MTTIEKIRAEIERMHDDIVSNNYDCHPITVFEDILSFLDTLEEPKKDFNQLYKDIAKSEWFKKSYVGKSLGDVVPVEEPVCEDISREEQIGLSVMLYLDTHIKHDKSLVCRGVTLKDAREWIRRKIASEEYVCEEQMEKELSEKIAAAYQLGLADKEKKMMKDAVERIVKVDAGGYPYIDATELYDYSADRPLAKEGDKVKLIIVNDND